MALAWKAGWVNSPRGFESPYLRHRDGVDHTVGAVLHSLRATHQRAQQQRQQQQEEMMLQQLKKKMSLMLYYQQQAIKKFKSLKL